MEFRINTISVVMINGDKAIEKESKEKKYYVTSHFYTERELLELKDCIDKIIELSK